VHRVRLVTDKDTNPLNEVELRVESLLNNDGVFAASGVVRYQPEKAVVGLKAGGPMALTQDRYARLAAAFLDEIEAKFR
jgi:hypothetical protein